MASNYVFVLISLAVLILRSTALPADAAPSAPQQPDSAAPPTPVDAAPKSEQPKAPKECSLYIGDKERKITEGCQKCWVPPEYIICKNGDWDFKFCDEHMKCVHTTECTTTCVPKPATTPRPHPPTPAESEATKAAPAAPAASEVATAPPSAPSGNMTKA